MVPHCPEQGLVERLMFALFFKRTLVISSSLTATTHQIKWKCCECMQMHICWEWNMCWPIFIIFWGKSRWNNQCLSAFNMIRILNSLYLKFIELFTFQIKVNRQILTSKGSNLLLVEISSLPAHLLSSVIHFQ